VLKHAQRGIFSLTQIRVVKLVRLVRYIRYLQLQVDLSGVIVLKMSGEPLLRRFC
jgi:hypothetical protein